MRNMRFNVAEFIAAYTKAAGDGQDVSTLASGLGISVQAVFGRKHALKKRGVTLPSLKKRSGERRRAARRTRTISLPAETGSVIATVGGVRLQFSIHVTEVPNGVA